MTVLENLLVAQHNPLMDATNFTIGGILSLPRYRRAQRARPRKAVYWLERIALVDRRDDPAADLPYGAQRRLEIARPMCTDRGSSAWTSRQPGLNARESGDLTSSCSSSAPSTARRCS
jgi:branched-chain amino acid transport system ATP-binding protein